MVKQICKGLFIAGLLGRRERLVILIFFFIFILQMHFQ